VTSPPPGAATSGPGDGPRPLVLIVDDNEKNLKLARDVLRAAAFRTLEAASGAEAIALATEHLPDVILMDLRLPDMDGTHAARALGRAARTASIPIVAVSSSPFGGDGDWFSDAGLAGYLQKPIDVLEFPEQVRRFCARCSS
jgi:two-component system cell cycle response regulator DivK